MATLTVSWRAGPEWCSVKVRLHNRLQWFGEPPMSWRCLGARTGRATGQLGLPDVRQGWRAHAASGARRRHYITMKIKKIALKLGTMSPEDKVSFASGIISSLTSNAATFPSPNPALPALTSGKNNLEARLAAIGQLETSLVAERAEAATAETELDALLAQEAAYVENVAKGEASVILLSGFALAQAKTSIGVLPPPTNLLGQTADVEGAVDLKWNRVSGAKSYIVECATSPSGPWTQVTVSTRTSCTASGLNSAVKYWFRVRAVGASGMSGWSDPAVKLAA
jgi:hypothetical protein